MKHTLNQYNDDSRDCNGMIKKKPPGRESPDFPGNKGEKALIYFAIIRKEPGTMALYLK